MKIDAKTEVSATVLGQVIGVSRKRVEQLAGERVIPRLAKGRFPLLAGVAGYIVWLKSDQRQAVKSASAGRIQDARAAEIELRMSDRQRVLHLAAQDHSVAVIDTVLGPMRSELQSVPARVTKDLALRQRLESELNGVLDSAADRASGFRRSTTTSSKLAADTAPVQSGAMGAKQPRLPAKRRRAGAA